MSQTHGYNPFDDGYSSSKQEYQEARYTINSHDEQTAGDSQYQDQSPGYREILSPPPASAPPPPPPSESDSGSVQSFPVHEVGSDDSSSSGFPTVATPPPSVHRSSPWENRYSSSSSNNGNNNNNHYGSYQNTRAAPVPMITNYGVSPAQTFYPSSDGVSFDGAPKMMSSNTVRGDISLRPNTGQTNSEIGGFGSLREVTARLRWMTIACTLSALIWEGFAFPARLLVHTWDHAAKVVLGGYLAFFCLLLLGVELNAPLRDIFGVLYHPLGRGFMLILMSSMCYGIHIAWWELLLCAAFAGCSSGYIYAYIKYPEYRRWQDYNDNLIWSDMMRRYAAQRSAFGQGSAHWADPGERTGSHVLSGNQLWRDAQRETQSLLHQV